MHQTTARRISSLFGIGNLPIMPGSWCSAIIALPALFIAESTLAQFIYVILAIVFTAVGLWTIPKVQPVLGTDPKSVVIDEAAGMALVLATPYAYLSIWWWGMCLLVFRIYDVVKPFPISRINNRTEGWSVVADDLLAAVFTIVTMMVLLPVFNVAMLLLL